MFPGGRINQYTLLYILFFHFLLSAFKILLEQQRGGAKPKQTISVIRKTNIFFLRSMKYCSGSIIED